MAVNWNPWHGCHKYSEGCANCYVYRGDARHGRDSSIVMKTNDFLLPVKRDRAGAYCIPAGELVWTCFTSDFLVKDADEWRPEAWRMMAMRSGLTFFFITKRILRLCDCVPADWGDGYPNVQMGCTMENQRRVDERMPVFKDARISQKTVVCEPLLGPVDFGGMLGKWANGVVVGGESGPNARECRYEWILDIRRQCVEAGVGFYFKQTGARFVKDGKLYEVQRKYQHSQARKAGINFKQDFMRLQGE